MQGSFSAADWAFQLGSMLVLVIGLILILAWLTQRMSNTSLKATRRMKVVDTLMLGRSERITLVQVGENYQLIGLSGAGISLLGQYDELPSAITADPDKTFSKFFRQAVNTRKLQVATQPPVDTACNSSSRSS